MCHCAHFTCDDVAAAGATHPLLARVWVGLLQQPDHLGVVGYSSAVPGRCQSNGQIHPGIIVLTCRDNTVYEEH